MIEALSLDQIVRGTNELIAKFEKEGVLWWIDKRWPQSIEYKFSLDRETAVGIIDTICEEFQKSPVYEAINLKFWEGNRDTPVDLGFRRLPEKGRRTWKEWIHYSIGGLFFSFSHYNRLNHFASAYIVEPSSLEAARFNDDGNTEYPITDSSILIITYKDIKENKPHLLHLMRTVDSAYKGLKTPSETSPAHLPRQNP